jgi:hypothetical protein
MAATAAQLAELREMVAEATEATYTDEALTTIIEAYPLPDALGVLPYTWDYSTTPPTQDPEETWIPTYDLHAAAAQVWQAKAAKLAGNFDFSADGASYSRSQAYEMAMKQSRHHAARRAPGTVTSVVEPRRAANAPYPGNAPEPD